MRLFRVSPLAVLLSLPLAAAAQFDPRVCADIADSAARLACYDAAVGAAEADDAPPVPRPPRGAAEPAAPLVTTEPAGRTEPASSATATRPGAPEAPEFGLGSRTPEADVPDTLTLRVAAARHSDFNGWTIEFENGQVWRQIGSDRFDIEVGERYVIRRASFDSFLLGAEDGNRKIRVTRVR